MKQNTRAKVYIYILPIHWNLRHSFLWCYMCDKHWKGIGYLGCVSWNRHKSKFINIPLKPVSTLKHMFQWDIQEDRLMRVSWKGPQYNTLQEDIKKKKILSVNYTLYTQMWTRKYWKQHVLFINFRVVICVCH